MPSDPAKEKSKNDYMKLEEANERIIKRN